MPERSPAPVRPGPCGAASLSIAASLLLTAPAAEPVQALSSEAFLNTLGVNTHLDGNSGWDTDATRIGEHLRWIGVRLQRDWLTSEAEGERFAAVRQAWGPHGRLWLSIPEDGPEGQRRGLALAERFALARPDLVYAIGGPNEEDDDYPQRLGATLPDAALVQDELYAWAHADGRAIVVSQMEFGAGWSADNGWRGDYDPARTGIHQDYVPGRADLAAAHSYVSDAARTPGVVLDQLRGLARLTTPGRRVAHTEVGTYRHVGLAPEVVGRYLVLGAFASAAAGDAAYFVYGLQDSDTDGFYDASDREPHPLADWFHTLTSLLASATGASAPGEPATFVPDRLELTTSGAGCGHLLLQKPEGAFVVACWSEQRLDGSQRPVEDRLGFGRRFREVSVFEVERGLEPLQVLHDVDGCALRLEPCDVYLVVLSDVPPRP